MEELKTIKEDVKQLFTAYLEKKGQRRTPERYAILDEIVGQKKAREIWFLCRQYNAQQALEMGLVNTVVPLEQLEEETVAWCRQMLQHSSTALRCLKAAMNADCDGQAGLQELAGAATLLFYQTEEGQEGRNAYVEKRPPDFGKFVRHP